MHLPLGNVRLILIHFAIWLFYILYESSILLIVDSVQLNLWETGFNFMLYAVIFYVSGLLIFPRFYPAKQYVWLLLSSIALIGVYILLRYGVYLYILPHLSAKLLRPYTDDKLFLAQAVWRGGYFVILSIGYFFAMHAIATERQRRKLAEIRIEREHQLREMDKSLKQAEITNLKNQINPHFLYNSLNFFYSQIYPHSEKTARGILLLSDIMRYALKDDDGAGKVMLEKEVQHLKNYIDMNQLRFNHTLQIRFEVIGNLRFRMIIPLLLITFVENCFKHGELFDPENPLIIRIEVSDDEFRFHTRNKKHTGTKEKSTGIGLANIKQRLAIKYPDAYSLELKDEADFYTCNLTLKL